MDSETASKRPTGLVELLADHHQRRDPAHDPTASPHGGRLLAQW
ncbi:MAG: hypothetical protein ACRDU8_01865 [Egibacteraceae bacterium]